VHNDGRNEREQRFVPTPFAHAILDDEIGVILDLRRDEFLGLSKVARHIWVHLVAGKTPEETTSMLALLYEAEPTLLLTDVLQFIHTMEERGLLERCAKGVQALRQPSKTITFEQLSVHNDVALSSKGSAPRMWQKSEQHEAFVTLQRVDDLVKRVGLSTFASALMNLPVHRRITAEDAEVQRLTNAVTETADWLPFNAACLHQSLALAWMLRRRHLHVDVVMGIYTHPFSAHVWLESDGYMVQWRAGMGYTADFRRIEAMTVIFHTGTLTSLAKEMHA
jgi:hypothetical protein